MSKRRTSSNSNRLELQHLPEIIPLRRSLRDPIHGTIRLSNEELGIVDHPLFRRLHHIKQNGLLYLVFPGATHSRFEHSLGVVHVADEMLRSIIFNSRVAAEKVPPAVATLDMAQDGEAVDFSKINPDTLKYLFRVVRLAALVHDLGHGPLSHTFDSFAPKGEQVAKIISSKTYLSDLKPLINDLASGNEEVVSETGRVKHEVMSCVLFGKILADRPGEDVTSLCGDVAAVILGRPALGSTGRLAGFTSLAHDLIASAPADADRMDYLERDSRSIGVTYGLFDRDRLLKSLLAYQDGQGTTKSLRLGLKKSGMRAVENFIQARFELFVQVYYHKTNRALERMLTAIAEAAKRTDVVIVNASDIDSLESSYLDLSDEKFLRMLQGEGPSAIDESEINYLAEQIRARHLWKRVYEGNPSGTDMIYAKLTEAYPGLPLEVDQIDPKATKDLTGGAALLTRSRDGYYRVDEQQGWTKASAIIGALASAEQGIARVYLKTSDGTQASTLRTEARELDTGKN